MAAYGLGIVVAPVLGPTLGGWLTDTYSWRYAFYINIPVGILAVIMISRFVHDPPYIKNAKVGAFDNIGFGLLVVWTGCLQIVLDKGQEDDWFGAVWVRWAVAALVISLVSGSGDRGQSQAGLVDLHVLKDRNLRVGCFMIALLGVCIYITIAILPLYYQEVMGYTAFAAGLVVWPARRRLVYRLARRRLSRLAHRQPQAAVRRFRRLRDLLVYLRFVNLDIGPLTLLVPIVLTGFALSFVFVPLATMATMTIRNVIWATQPASSTCCATSADRWALPWRRHFDPADELPRSAARSGPSAEQSSAAATVACFRRISGPAPWSRGGTACCDGADLQATGAAGDATVVHQRPPVDCAGSVYLRHCWLVLPQSYARRRWLRAGTLRALRRLGMRLSRFLPPGIEAAGHAPLEVLLRAFQVLKYFMDRPGSDRREIPFKVARSSDQGRRRVGFTYSSIHRDRPWLRVPREWRRRREPRGEPRM